MNIYKDEIISQLAITEKGEIISKTSESVKDILKRCRDKSIEENEHSKNYDGTVDINIMAHLGFKEVVSYATLGKNICA